jgi:hypothetical protein
MDFEYNLSNGVHSLVCFIHKYQVTSLFLFAFVCLSIASALDANDGLLLNFFPPEVTIYDIFHPVLDLFYASVKIPKDCGTGSPWLLVHLIFVSSESFCVVVVLCPNSSVQTCFHLGKSLSRIDASVDANTYPEISAFFFPITNFIDENVSLMFWILFASTIYLICIMLSPIDRNRLNPQEAIHELRLTYQQAINDLINKLSDEQSRSATTSND